MTAIQDVLEDVHLVCCRPTRALCGAPALGAYAGEDEDVTCLPCEIVDQAAVPCGAVLCRLRQWWRNRRSS